MKSKIIKMSLIIIILIFVFFYWLNYATTAKPDFATYSIGFKTESVSTYDLTNGLYDKKLSRMDEYAELSDIVYRRGEKENLNTFNNWSRILTPMENIEPEDNNRKILGGFYYELWELREANKTIVAIVFKGTEELSDWVANLRWFRRIFDKTIWDHYDQLHKISELISKSIKSRYTENENLEIVSIGHSLGGGLAQFMAYSIPEINYVFAFNPSPVTAYYDVKPKSKRNENKKDAVIYRIYESGEGLSFVRKFMTILYPAPLFETKDPALIRIRLSFSTGKNSITQHSMKALAENLRNYKRDKKFKIKE